MSPESLTLGSEREPYDPFQSDIWALCIILLNITSGLYPWRKALDSDAGFDAFLTDKNYLRGVSPSSTPQRPPRALLPSRPAHAPHAPAPAPDRDRRHAGLVRDPDTYRLQYARASAPRSLPLCATNPQRVIQLHLVRVLPLRSHLRVLRRQCPPPDEIPLSQHRAHISPRQGVVILRARSYEHCERMRQASARPRRPQEAVAEPAQAALPLDQEDTAGSLTKKN
ncbi:hypothetical protein C8R44DRAFT_872230 [Mycena epipterygia]|nr:hypothetical protein C8R44DRAFT_872230 [Mycena epipterygia]